MFPRLKIFFSLLAFLLTIYLVFRIIFFLQYFDGSAVDGKTLLNIFYWGLRMDLVAAFLINLLAWIYLFFIGDFIRSRNLRRKILFYLLLIVNIPFVLLNLIDLTYFNFTLRRSTVDIIDVFYDSRHAWGEFFRSYWYLFLLGIGNILLLILVFGKLCNRYTNEIESTKIQFRGSLRNRMFYLVVLVIFFIFSRGISRQPITPAVALLHMEASYQPAAENSTVTFLYSILRKQTVLQPKNYFSPGEENALFTIDRQFNARRSAQKKNVIVFVLESFSKNLLDKESRLKARTPFLDSLMTQGFICNNAYANGLESNKGLVALLAGLPPLMDEAYYNSSYSSNPFKGIGTLLKEEGYSTNFFMGASPDHFGFGKLCKLVGIDNYYSEKEYGNSKDHDGTWGIYDHKFLPYAASILKEKKDPFFAVVFNISSHHPYNIPSELKGQFAISGQSAQQIGVTYVDYSLKLFFDRIRSMDWYKNSIFVFVADHAVTFDVKPRAVLYTAFQIPFFVHIPDMDSSVQINKTVQQMDLVPTIFELLHYNQPFMSFGRSIFDSSDAFAVNKIFGDHQLIRGNFIYGYNEKEEQPSYFYEFKSDSLLKHNLLPDSSFQKEKTESEKKLKAILQRFNNSLLKHQLQVH